MKKFQSSAAGMMGSTLPIGHMAAPLLIGLYLVDSAYLYLLSALISLLAVGFTFCTRIYLNQMRTNKKALLLISLGTPDSPNFIDVGKYLSEFLMDSRMIRVPWLLRFILVNLIIVPTRSFSSSKAYKELWTERGSPLKYHMEDLTEKVGVKAK